MATKEQVEKAREELRRRRVEFARKSLQSQDRLNLGRAALQGATLGFGDELVAGGRAILRGESPRKVLMGESETARALLESERANLQSIREKAPNASLGLEVGGGFAIPGAGILGAAKSAPTMLGSIARGAGAGALAGGIGGAGAARGGVLDRVDDALIGMALGGATGGALGPVGGMVSKKVVGEGPSRVEGISQRKVLEALEDQGDDVTSAIGKLRRDPNITLGDLGDETRGIVRGLAGGRGPGRSRTVKALEAREGESRQRVNQAINTAFGNKTARQSFNEIDAAQRAAARREYQKLYQLDVTITPGIQAALDRPHMRSALNKARKIAADEGIRFPKKLEGRISLELMDIIKRASDDVFENNPGITNQLTGKVKNTDSARAANTARRNFIDQVDRQTNGQYAKIRESYAGSTKLKRALDLGRKSFDEKMDIEELDEALATFSPSELEAWRTGFAQKLREINEGGGATRNVANFFIKNPKRRALLERAMPNERSRSAFMGNLERELNFRETSESALRGSRTTPFERDIQKLENLPSETHKFVRGTLPEKVSNMVSRLFRRTDEATARAVNDRLSKVMLSDPAVAEDFLLKASQAQNPKQLNFMIRQFLGGVPVSLSSQISRDVSRIRERNKRPAAQGRIAGIKGLNQ